MDGFSRISRAITTFGLPEVEGEGSLPIEQILEEEYARLHPGEVIRTHAHPSQYVPGDIAYPADLATVLMNAVRTVRESERPTGWTRQPPAPHATSLQEVAAFFVSGQTQLVDALHTYEAGGVTTERLREHLAARLNALLAVDLDAVACFAPIARRILAGDDESDDTADERDAEAGEARRVTNKRLLDVAFEPYLATTRDKRLEAVMAQLRRSNHFALCLSGGGIRSASFALGVLQGLGRYELLPRFHYLSTVSGGGFAGGWLSAWMSRAGVRSVWRHLRGAATVKLDDEPPPMRHVRTFSRYLNPQLGLMSADTWTLIASGVRNILLMWVVMLPLMASVLMIPRMFIAWSMVALNEWSELGVDPASLAVFLFVVATLLIFAALVHVHRYVRQHPADADGHPVSAGSTLGAFHMRCLIPLVVGVALLTQVWELLWTMTMETSISGATVSQQEWAQRLIDSTPDGLPTRAVGAWLLGVYGLGLALTSWIVGAKNWYRRPVEGIGCALAGAAAGALAAVADDALFGIAEVKHGPAFYATFAVPTFLALSVVGTQIFVGLVSRKMQDSEREAAARLNAWLLIILVAWISAFGLALFGPVFASAVLHAPSRVVLTVLGCAAFGLLAARIAARTDERAQGAKGVLGRAVALLAAPAFAASIIVLISALDGRLLAIGCQVSAWCPEAVNGRYRAFVPNTVDLRPGDFAHPPMVAAIGLMLLIVGLALSRLIDTNRFSLHAIYSVRLVRTFIGASKAPSDRAPDSFTGFDATDDMPMKDLWPARVEMAPPAACAESVGHPPLHVINMALYVVSCERLATQERKAESFTVTALHAGSRNVGYRRTSGATDSPTSRLYGGDGGITLGTAVAVSGAAASPNAGYHSSPVITFLMALFNLRLGRWLGNPGPSGDHTFDRAEPRLGFLPIVNEMFGRTTDRSPYVYLSDGSHFENLGLYEMVFRRCRFIVVSDAGCDPTAAFDDLGGAIRKIRIDFGVPIEFDGEMSIFPRTMPEMADRGVYWAVARIRYSAVDRDAPLSADRASSEEDGILLYLKPAFYGREPRDVYNYARKVPAFPHESTGNQFYGEKQFESYRALGAHVIEELCAKEFGVRNGYPVTAETLNAWMEAQLARPTVAESKFNSGARGAEAALREADALA